MQKYIFFESVVGVRSFLESCTPRLALPERVTLLPMAWSLMPGQGETSLPALQDVNHNYPGELRARNGIYENDNVL